jgi:hypothetical protein
MASTVKVTRTPLGGLSLFLIRASGYLTISRKPHFSARKIWIPFPKLSTACKITSIEEKGYILHIYLRFLEPD